MNQAISTIYLALQLACLVLWTQAPAPSPRTSAAIPAAVLSLASAVAIGPLSYLEHTRSPRPSTLLSAFLSLTTLLEVATTRSLWLRQSDRVLSYVFVATVAVKFVMLILEAQAKSLVESAEPRETSPETTGGIFTRSLFLWLNPLFLKGRKTNLELGDLSGLEPEFASEDLNGRMKRAWTERKSAHLTPTPLEEGEN
jgi:ATP-binding cassette subfamily C (CFTR/MRP) protein 1